MTGWQSAVHACMLQLELCREAGTCLHHASGMRVTHALHHTLVLSHQLGKLWAGNGVPRISMLGMDISVEESEQHETTPSAGCPRCSPVTHPDGFLILVLEAGSRMQLELWGNPSWSQHLGGPRVSRKV